MRNGRISRRLAVVVMFLVHGLQAADPQAGVAATVDLATDSAKFFHILGADGDADVNSFPLGDSLLFALAGDVNGDGLEDLVFSAIGGDGAGNGTPDVGEIYVVFGGAGAFASGTLLDLATEAADVRILGDKVDEGISAYVVGDVDTDGIDDLVFGSSTANNPGKTQAGEVNVLYGPLAPGTIDLSVTPPDLTIVGREGWEGTGFPGDRTFPAALGDVDGDGFNDLLIAAWLADGPSNGRPEAGELDVVFGGPGSVLEPPGSPQLVHLEDLTDLLLIHGADVGDTLGTGFAAVADLDGDGVDDIIISTWGDGPGGPARTDAGEILVIRGGPALTPPPGTEVTRDLATDPAEVTLHGAEGAETGAFASGSVPFGDLLTSFGHGDFNGDGFEDLIAGAFLADGPLNSRPDAGEAYVVFGGPGSKLDPGSPPAQLDLALPGTADVLILGVEEGPGSGSFELGDWAGYVVGSADLDDDERSEIVVSALFADGPANARLNAGETYVVQGSAALPPLIDLAIPGEVDLQILGPEEGAVSYLDQVGDAILFDGAADLDGDGVDELLICSFLADGPGNTRNRAGEIWVVREQSLTPQGQLAALIELGEALVETGALNPGQGNALNSKLEAVGRKLEKGNVKAARNQLNAYENQVETFIAAGILTPVQGQPLIEGAEKLAEALESS